MNRTNEIELLTNPTHHTMDYNGYIKSAIIIDDGINHNIVIIKFNKEYFN